MSSSVNPGNSSHASKHSRGNTDFGATNQRPDVSHSEKNSEGLKAPLNSDEYIERESQNADYGVQSEVEEHDRATN